MSERSRSESTLTVAGIVVLRCDATGPPVGTTQDALDLIGAAAGARASWILLPVERLDERFFHLANGMAGEFLQKLVNYGLRLAIVGLPSAGLEQSKPLRDFVRESNRGRQIWFVAGEAELAERLQEAR